MKKFLIAAMVFLAFSQVEAQVTFSPGLRAGANFSHFTQGDLDYNYNNGGINFDPNTGQPIRLPESKFTSKTDFYVGFYGALRLTKFYTLQPEVTYSRQGSKLESYSSAPNGIVRKMDSQFDLSYISVGIINKFTFNDKFNMHIGPTIDILAEQSGNSDYQPQNFNNYYYYDSYNANSDIDLAFVFGLGYNFTKNIGIEARVKKGVIPVLDWSDYHTNVVFSAGLTYTFDVSGAGTTTK